ncbi:hypothetical protein JHK87_012345 [Glycine soja]|nr:hypothetical protein JHK87_012345 [Glycine soja]
MQTLGLLVALILGFYQKFLYFSLRFLLLMLMDFLSKFKFFTQASELGCYALFFSSPTTRNHLSSKDNNSKEEENLREESMEDEVFNVMSWRKIVKKERQHNVDGNTNGMDEEWEVGSCSNVQEDFEGIDEESGYEWCSNKQEEMALVHGLIEGMILVRLLQVGVAQKAWEDYCVG